MKFRFSRALSGERVDVFSFTVTRDDVQDTVNRVWDPVERVGRC